MTDHDPGINTKTVSALTSEIGKIIGLHSLDMQGAVLAQAVAVWIAAGHRVRVPNVLVTEETLQRAALEGWLELVEKLIPEIREAVKQRDKIRAAQAEQRKH